jgi:peptidoglycan/LPS O-acetylase OafA/YrhL
VLRALACAGVVVEHLCRTYPAAPKVVSQFTTLPPYQAFKPFWEPAAQFFAQRVHFNWGVCGLIVLFQISGFVIPFSLEHGSASSFALRRVLRVYPTLWCALLPLVALIALQAHVSHVPGPFTLDQVGANLLLVTPYVGLGWVDPVAWTIPVELLFYAIVALMSAAGLLRRPPAVLGVATLAAVLATFVGSDQTHAPFGALGWWLAFNATFVLVILLGLCWNRLYARTWRPATCAATAGGIAALFAISAQFGPLHLSATTWFFSVPYGVIAFGLCFALRDRLPYSRAIDRLAGISYPLYLVHGVIGYILLNHLTALTGSYYLSLAVALVVVVWFAWLLHARVEGPSAALAKRLTTTWRRRRSVIVGATWGWFR